MGDRSEESSGARALRAAGYVRLPNWWVTIEQRELVEYMCKGNIAEVNRIKRNAEYEYWDIPSLEPGARDNHHEKINERKDTK